MVLLLGRGGGAGDDVREEDVETDVELTSNEFVIVVSCVWMLQRGHSGDGCVLASNLCKYDLRKGDLFVLSWARVRRVRQGSISSELLVCGGGVRSILLLPLVARCLETIDVCIWCMFVFMSVVVTVWGSVGMFVV